MSALANDPLTHLDNELYLVQYVHLLLRLARLIPDQVIQVVECVLIQPTLHKHQYHLFFLLLAIAGLMNLGCNGCEGKSVYV